MKLREPLIEAQINKLAEALQNPASVHGRRNHDGFVCLSGENANWQLYDSEAVIKIRLSFPLYY